MTDRNPLSFKGNELIRSGAIMALAIIVQVVVVMLATRLTEGKRADKLARSVQSMLGSEWQVGERLAIDAPIATSSTAFALYTGVKAGEQRDVNTESADGIGAAHWCVVIRVVTIYGPMPCVYVCNISGAHFAGVLSLHGTVSHTIRWERSKGGMQAISYWERIVPSLVNIGGGNVQ